MEDLERKRSIPEGKLHEIAMAVFNETYADHVDEAGPPPVEECANIVRLPAWEDYLGSHKVLWQGGTIVMSGEIARLRYDDGRVTACLVDEEAIQELILQFYHDSECWR